MKRFACCCVWMIGASLAAVPVAADAQSEEEQALAAVREEIEALERRLERQHAERDAEYQALKRVELDVAEATRALEGVRSRRARQLERQRSLAAEARRATGRLDAERAALARQVRLSYMTGRQELFKLLLSQEDPARLGRMMVYYDHFNRARSERIAAVSSELARLDGLAEQSRQTEAELDRLEREQAQELDGRARARAERRSVVASLERSIGASGGEMERLRGEERRLSELVRELEEALARFPVDAEEPFPSIKGRLAWPVSGRVAGDFGARRSGSVRWRGMLVATAGGAPVRSVYHGRVVFADWLPGLGLLIIVDHGDGYMSLYGHNETLLKESGDWVTPGEVIAQVGDTGGQAEPGLYFEIRREGEPVDPRPWMSAGPDGG